MSEITKGVIGMPLHMAMASELSRAQFHARAQELLAENERLQRFETAYKEFSDKTDWVRPNATAHELGMHVADVIRKRCGDLTSHNQAQADEIVRLRVDVERFDFIASDAESGLQKIYGDDWLAAVDAAMGTEPRP